MKTVKLWLIGLIHHQHLWFFMKTSKEKKVSFHILTDYCKAQIRDAPIQLFPVLVRTAAAFSTETFITDDSRSLNELIPALLRFFSCEQSLYEVGGSVNNFFPHFLPPFLPRLMGKQTRLERRRLQQLSLRFVTHITCPDDILTWVLVV